MTQDSRDERVAELESRVRDLEATVKGLTEELVEAHERIRVLEGTGSADRANAGATNADDAGSEGGSPAGRNAAETGREGGATPEPSEGSKGAETQERTKTEEEADGLDDIIVA